MASGEGQRSCCIDSANHNAVHLGERGRVQINVLLVGGGGREHALAWKLAQSPVCATLFCAPSNPGISAERSVTGVTKLDTSSHDDVVEFCKRQGIDLVFVGPEAPLVDGLVDTLRAGQIATFGPSKAAAQLEGSKAFMKVRAIR